MANPFANKAKDSNKAKFSNLTGISGGGQKFDGSKQNDAAIAKRTAKGGSDTKVPGKKSGGRLDKFARGGKVKETNVNIAIVVPNKTEEGAPPVNISGGPPMPPGGPGPIPLGPPPGLEPGGPPMMQNRGGSVGAFAKGGAVKVEAGDNGVGRLEKAKKAVKRG